MSSSSNRRPYWLAGQPQQAGEELEVTDKWSGERAFTVSLATTEVVEEAIAGAHAARRPMAELPAYKRRDVLTHCVKRFEERREELTETLRIEAGKPVKDARGEVQRLIDTFRIAAEEATRIGGEVIPMDVSERGEGYRGAWKRVPIGPCSFISPFNFPLNLAAHKVAPAIAAGCPFVLKPASLTPVGALQIGEVLAECDLPEGSWSILPTTREAAGPFTTDDRLKLLSFTGSPQVGWKLKEQAGKKKVTLELGGNAMCLLDEGTDLEDALERLVVGAYYQSGQSCISVQRILVHRSLLAEFRKRWVARVEALVAGDPAKEDTFIGPMISETEASRLEDWVKEAQKAGAKVLTGGTREGRLFQATVLEEVPDSAKISCEEAFGPVSILEPFDDFEEALERINASDYGLQAGIFTREHQRVQLAWDRLEVGGVLIDDVPSYRVDHMPYGGVKDSGLGREGLRYAIEDMSEIRLLVTRLRR